MPRRWSWAGTDGMGLDRGVPGRRAADGYAIIGRDAGASGTMDAGLLADEGSPRFSAAGGTWRRAQRSRPPSTRPARDGRGPQRVINTVGPAGGRRVEALATRAGRRVRAWDNDVGRPLAVRARWPLRRAPRVPESSTVTAMSVQYTKRPNLSSIHRSQDRHPLSSDTRTSRRHAVPGPASWSRRRPPVPILDRAGTVPA